MQNGCGQYCPIAKGAEIFAERWTPLIIRNLHVGARTFGEIAAGCPGMSTTLLVQRLHGLERAGVIERRPNVGARGSLYYLTPAGQELVDVALQLGNWGARWLELAPQDYDPFVVLWAGKMHVVLERLPQPRIVIGFDLRDRPKEKFWLLLQKPEPELCIKHPGYDEDVVITTDSRTPGPDIDPPGPTIARGRGASGSLVRRGRSGAGAWPTHLGWLLQRFAGVRPVRAATV
jgi:DNA-binding HxlR family transcriptional regulator